MDAMYTVYCRFCDFNRYANRHRHHLQEHSPWGRLSIKHETVDADVRASELQDLKTTEGR